MKKIYVVQFDVVKFETADSASKINWRNLTRNWCNLMAFTAEDAARKFVKEQEEQDKTHGLEFEYVLETLTLCRDEDE